MNFIKDFIMEIGRKLKNVLSTLCVIVLLLMLLTGLGTLVFKRGNVTSVETKSSQPVIVEDRELDREVKGAMDIAREAAYEYASTELDIWINEMMARADEDFLDDYFSFMQTKRRELTSLYNTIAHRISKKALSAEEVAVKKLEDEIERKVIKQEISQARIENITKEAIDVYLTVLDRELDKIREINKYPVGDWNKYVADLCGLTLDVDAKKYPIALKSVVVSGIGLTGFTAYKVVPMVKDVAVKVSSKIAKNTASTVAKTGTAVAAKTAGKAAKAIPYVGWGITAAICIWDIVDYAKTAEEGKVMLRKSLNEYFREVKKQLLGKTEDGIMGSIMVWENSMIKKMR